MLHIAAFFVLSYFGFTRVSDATNAAVDAPGKETSALAAWLRLMMCASAFVALPYLVPICLRGGQIIALSLSKVTPADMLIVLIPSARAWRGRGSSTATTFSEAPNARPAQRASK